MPSPQEDYSYEELKHYLEVAETALDNFRQQYIGLRVETWQPEQQVINDVQDMMNTLRNRVAEANAYLEPDEIDGIQIGTYSRHDNRTKRKKLNKRIEKARWQFRKDLRELVNFYEIQLKGLYGGLSDISAKFTADRIQELHRREEWVEKQRQYLADYHIKKCREFSPLADSDMVFITSAKDASEISAVYILFKDGEIIYIGSSQNLKKRLLNHDIVRKSYCKDDYLGYKIECVFTECDINKARTVERQMIRMINPQFNRQGKDE